ncbi:MAG: phage portal protein, partial [Pseudomonadota bacterium]
MINEKPTTQKSTGTRKPIEQGLLSRVVNGVKYITTANTAWMPPGEPVAPIASPQPVARQFDYPVAVNIQRQPRNDETISFADLRNLADNWGTLRAVIETRKDQMAKLAWSIKPKDPKQQIDSRCQEIETFFLQPDKFNDWEDWLRQILEDHLVIDAPTIYAQKTLGGKPYAFEIIDGATIKRVITAQGRTPLPPEPAYQQVLKGVTAVNYTTEELIYFPRNKRSHKLYGYSPVEQIVMIINIALRRELHQLHHFTEGNVPEALVESPAGWNPEQIRAFQLQFDAMNAGNSAERSRMKFVPSGSKLAFTKDPMLKDEFDEWLARV